jgi:threonine dehydratase
MLPTSTQLDRAAQVVYGTVKPTPQYAWPLLRQALGTEVWVKHENHMLTGAFKVRGGLVYVDGLRTNGKRLPGLVSATRGNHGQSLGLAAQQRGLQTTIVVPHGNSREKNGAMRALGVELVEHGIDFQEAREHAARLAAEQNLHFVPSFHRDLVAGVATYWVEFFRSLPQLHTVFVPIGQGSGVCAAIAAREATQHRARIVGVVSAHAHCYALSFRALRAIPSTATTRLADGLACRVPDQDALDLILKHVDDVVEVADEEIACAMRLYFAATHNVAEGAGAAALAGALQQRGSLRGKIVGLPLTGGNVDASVFAEVLNGAPSEDQPCPSIN